MNMFMTQSSLMRMHKLQSASSYACVHAGAYRYFVWMYESLSDNDWIWDFCLFERKDTYTFIYLRICYSTFFGGRYSAGMEKQSPRGPQDSVEAREGSFEAIPLLLMSPIPCTVTVVAHESWSASRQIYYVWFNSFYPSVVLVHCLRSTM